MCVQGQEGPLPPYPPQPDPVEAAMRENGFVPLTLEQRALIHPWRVEPLNFLVFDDPMRKCPVFLACAYLGEAILHHIVALHNAAIGKGEYPPQPPAPESCCPKCGGRIAVATCNYLEFTFDPEPFKAGIEEEPGGESIGRGDIFVEAHICTECSRLADVAFQIGIDEPPAPESVPELSSLEDDE